MKCFFRNTVFSVFISILISCSSFNLSQVDRDILKKCQKVGLHDFEVSIASQSTLSAKIKKGLSNQIFSDSNNSQDDKQKLKEIVVNAVLKNFLDKGYQPIERERLRQILKEYSLQQAGVIDTVKEFKLLGIDGIFTGSLQVKVFHEFWSDRALISFSGRFIKMDDGMILASGSLSREYNEINEMNIIKLIDDWFSSLKKIY